MSRASTKRAVTLVQMDDAAVLSVAETGRPGLNEVHAMAADDDNLPTTAQSLATWRAAERAVVITKRGRVSAEAAAAAADEAATKAAATADAAEAALAAVTLAEASASESADAARVVTAATRADVVNATSDVAAASEDEAAAREEYRRSATRAASNAK